MARGCCPLSSCLWHLQCLCPREPLALSALLQIEHYDFIGQPITQEEVMGGRDPLVQTEISSVVAATDGKGNGFFV